MTEKKINSIDIKLGMRITRDVYTNTDMFLIAANTIITQNHILKLELYKVKSVYIDHDVTIKKEASVKPTQRPVVATESLPKLAESEEFKAFENQYEQHLGTISDTYVNILEGGEVNEEALINITDNVLDNVRHTSDVFSYLCRLGSKDDVTFQHVLNVSILATIFGKWLNFSDVDIRNLTLAGMLHDIGKTQISDAILKKPGSLTDAEFTEMKKHTLYGYNLLSETDIPDGVKQAVLMHHEKMNGYGYPLGVPWDQIHPYTKVIGIVDIYEAMTADRPYRKRLHPFQVIKMFEEECYGVLDTKYLYIFLENIARNYLGNVVRLIDGRLGKIVFINPTKPSLPMVDISGDIIDLSRETHLTIESFI